MVSLIPQGFGGVDVAGLPRREQRRGDGHGVGDEGDSANLQPGDAEADLRVLGGDERHDVAR